MNLFPERMKSIKRKVIIFSFYADTVKWINDFLLEAIKTDDTFSVYKKN